MRIWFDQQKAYLENVNARSEFKGDERQPAGDLKFSVEVPNSALSHFHPTLKSAFYFHDSARPKDLADQGLEENPDYLPHLRFPNLETPLKWKDEMTGGSLTIHQGLGGVGSDIVLEDIKVNEFKLSPKDGGTLKLEFRVQAHPDEKQFGKLCGSGLIQSECMISLKAPEAPPIQ